MFQQYDDRMYTFLVNNVGDICFLTPTPRIIDQEYRIKIIDQHNS